MEAVKLFRKQKSNGLTKLQKLRIAAVSMASVFFVYLFLMPFNYALYDTLLFPLPDFRTPDLSSEIEHLRNSGITVEDVYFPSANGKQLHGMFFSRPNSKRTFLFSHGRGNNIFIQLPKVRQLVNYDAAVFMYDYQGFGRSHGRPTVTGACEDALAAYDYVSKRQANLSHNNIIGIGESFGAGVTAWLSQRRNLSGTVMLSGFSSLPQAGKDKLFWLNLYPDLCFPKERNLDNVAVLRAEHPPVLIVHGRGDRTISFNHSLDLFSQAKGAKKFLELPGGHCTWGSGREFPDTLRSFIKEYSL